MFSFLKKKHKEKELDTIEKKEDFENIETIANYFRNETGITFDKQISILKNKVITFCRLREIYSIKELLRNISHNAQLKQELIDYLTTNETFFYREFKQIEELVNLVKKQDNKVDILCAPSATGEEPYSIAIALLEAGVAPHMFHIVGIDINNETITKAKEAIYKQRNIRNLSPTVLSKYFRKDDTDYILNQSIKSQVTFKVINIFDPSFKHIGRFDYIFSRNMLIYFDKEVKLKAKKILEDLRKNQNQEVFFGHADLF